MKHLRGGQRGIEMEIAEKPTCFVRIAPAQSNVDHFENEVPIHLSGMRRVASYQHINHLYVPNIQTCISLLASAFHFYTKIVYNLKQFTIQIK